MIINIKVHPGSKQEKILNLGGCNYEVYVKEMAEKGKANLALVKILSKTFNIGAKNIKIKNPTSRKKIVEVVL